MEPQDIYRQRLDTDYERSSFRLHAYEQEKIKEQKYKGNFLLTSIMQVVFIILSAFYFFISSSASPRINSLLINFPLLINFLSINIFSF